MVRLMSPRFQYVYRKEADLQFCVDHIAEGAKYQANHLQKETQHAMNRIITIIYLFLQLYSMTRKVV